MTSFLGGGAKSMLCAFVVFFALSEADFPGAKAEEEKGGLEALIDAISPVPAPEVYTIEFQGLDAAPELRAVVEPALLTVQLQRKAAVDEIQLRRRAAADLGRLVRALRSQGYFEAEAKTELRLGAEDEKPTVLFIVELGRRFTISRHRITTLGARRDGADFQLAKGTPAVSSDILAAEKAALAALQASGRPYAAIASRDAVADLDAKTLSVETVLRAGPEIEIGGFSIDGADRVEADYIGSFFADLIGQPAAPSILAERERELRATGLFRLVRVSLPPEPPVSGVQNIQIAVEEAALRSIGGGVRYDTADGPGARTFWEHRSLFGAGEKFRVELEAATAEQALTLTFRKPRFLSPERAVLAALELDREYNDAYERVGATASVGVEERFSDRIIGVARLVVELSEVDDGSVTETSTLVGLPLELRIDATDNRVDPKSGWRARILTAPFVGVFGDQQVTFVQAELGGSTYYALDEDGRIVAAGRGRIAAIAGAELSDVPINHRLFGGGGGSVRAFATRRVGPLDAVGDPTGGLTAADIGLELRIRVTDRISVAPFFDAGFVSAEPFDFSLAEIQAGPGVGVRFVSPIGVVRGDLSAPIDPRDGDAPIQVYLSIGQEF